MKQIFYGPMGCGKTYLILHGLLPKKKLMIISTYGLEQEFKNVGLNDVPIKTLPISIEDTADIRFPNIIIHHPDDVESLQHVPSGFDLSSIPEVYPEYAINKISEWLEGVGISDDPDYTIVFTGIGVAISDPAFLRRMENWAADIVLEYTCRISIIDECLQYIRISGQWFEIPILPAPDPLKLRQIINLLMHKGLKKCELWRERDYLETHAKTKKYRSHRISFEKIESLHKIGMPYKDAQKWVILGGHQKDNRKNLTILGTPVWTGTMEELWEKLQYSEGLCNEEVLDCHITGLLKNRIEIVLRNRSEYTSRSM